MIMRKQDTYILEQANKRLGAFKQHMKIVHGFVPLEWQRGDRTFEEEEQH
jgi:hypothetical protein